ncbi:MAG: AAA family ATPase [Candidatus Eremiobacterota bacterium]
MVELTHIRVQNVRCFEDSQLLDLRKLNLFIGANNSGKTALLSSIELALRSTAGFGRAHGPLCFDLVDGFRSFDAVLRKQWTRVGKRPTNFVVECSWKFSEPDAATNGGGPGELFWGRFQCQDKFPSGEPVVSLAEFGLLPDRSQPLVRFTRQEPGLLTPQEAVVYEGPLIPTDPGVYERRGDTVTFTGSFPNIWWFTQDARLGVMVDLLGRVDPSLRARGSAPVRTIKPSRPDPRSVYVLDDPSLDEEQLDLLRTLLQLFAPQNHKSDTVAAIRRNLQLLGLASNINVEKVQRSTGILAEIKVETPERYSRNPVTIADVGFGLSQVLPLVVREAGLHDSCLVAYEPETHLHPLAQSRLADLFMASVGKGNRVFVETHSVYLILRLQTLIARGEVDPKDVAVYCVEASDRKATVTPMHFDEQGVPERTWPKNFLDTDFVLARELAQERNLRRK